LLIERLLKVATPLTALTVVVPESVPLEGFVPIASVIGAVELVTTVPPESSTDTLTAGAIDVFATVFDGWTVNASLVAAWPLNVTVNAPFPPKINEHGLLLVLLHVSELVLAAALHPANVDVPFAVA
jgi:hypothetical protein